MGRQAKVSICHFVPREIRIVGAAVGLGGKLILTVSFFGRLGLFGSSPPESKPIAVRIGGRGGILEPDGFGSGFWSSDVINAQMLAPPPQPVPIVIRANIGSKVESSESGESTLCLSKSTKNQTTVNITAERRPRRKSPCKMKRSRPCARSCFQACSSDSVILVKWPTVNQRIPRGAADQGLKLLEIAEVSQPGHEG